MKNRAGFAKVMFAGEDAPCAAEGCSAVLREGDTVFVDVWDDAMPEYCAPCGACERYDRMNAMDRGEYERPQHARA